MKNKNVVILIFVLATILTIELGFILRKEIISRPQQYRIDLSGFSGQILPEYDVKGVLITRKPYNIDQWDKNARLTFKLVRRSAGNIEEEGIEKVKVRIWQPSSIKSFYYYAEKDFVLPWSHWLFITTGEIVIKDKALIVLSRLNIASIIMWFFCPLFLFGIGILFFKS